ncbi:MAG: hypothetical protein ACXAEU_01945 [Candidatus Hodarchaeales archaeon]|jgi:hypothetical protein
MPPVGRTTRETCFSSTSSRDGIRGGCQKLASSDPIKEKCLLDGCNDSMYRFVKIHDRYTSRRLDEC